MDEKRRNEIAYRYVLALVGEKLSLRDIADFEREVGNLIKKPELAEIEISKEEAIQFFKAVVREAFNRKMANLKWLNLKV